jgi:hypothetical protein
MTDNCSRTDNHDLETRVEEEMVVGLPDGERLVRSIADVVGVGRLNHRPVPYQALDDRSPQDRALTFLLAAWCGSKLADDRQVRYVEKPELSRVCGASAWRSLRDDGWTAERLERHGGGVALRPARVNDAVNRLVERYATRQTDD